MSFTENRQNSIVYMTSECIKTRHAFTTRFGGVSSGEFSALNLASNRGDDPECVHENYRRVCALMGVGENDAAVTRQVHGTVVRIATEDDRHVPCTDVPYDADGLVTNVRNMPIMCFTADCVPALLCDEKAGVIGAVHCGWRSSVGDILGVAVEKMCSLGASPENICAAMGPAIGKCCFETDGDVPEAVKAYLGADYEGTCLLREDGKYLVDLREADRRRLLQLGIKNEHIDISEECTMCSHDKYWSHRYTKGRRGIQCAVIVLK